MVDKREEKRLNDGLSGTSWLGLNNMCVGVMRKRERERKSQLTSLMTLSAISKAKRISAKPMYGLWAY